MMGYNDVMKRPIDPRRIEVIDPNVAAIWRANAPHERIALVGDAHRTARTLLQAQIKRMNPDWSDEQVLTEVARRLGHGTDGPSSVRPRRP